MASSKEHREKAARFDAFLAAMTNSPHLEWRVVGAFYVAIHLVERIGACFNIHSNNHGDRSILLKSNHLKKYLSDPEIKRLRDGYEALFDAAHVARYGTVNHFLRAFTPEVIEKRIIGAMLPDVRLMVDSWFSHMAMSPP